VLVRFCRSHRVAAIQALISLCKSDRSRIMDPSVRKVKAEGVPFPSVHSVGRSIDKRPHHHHQRNRSLDIG